MSEQEARSEEEEEDQEGEEYDNLGNIAIYKGIVVGLGKGLLRRAGGILCWDGK